MGFWLLSLRYPYRALRPEGIRNTQHTRNLINRTVSLSPPNSRPYGGSKYWIVLENVNKMGKLRLNSYWTCGHDREGPLSLARLVKCSGWEVKRSMDGWEGNSAEWGEMLYRVLFNPWAKSQVQYKPETVGTGVRHSQWPLVWWTRAGPATASLYRGSRANPGPGGICPCLPQAERADAGSTMGPQSSRR